VSVIKPLLHPRERQQSKKGGEVREALRVSVILERKTTPPSARQRENAERGEGLSPTVDLPKENRGGEKDSPSS